MIDYKEITVGNSTYKVASDDSCLVVKVGKKEVWLSKNMCQWIKKHYKKYTA